MDYVHVKNCGYWEYHRLQPIRHMPYYSLYLKPLDEYLPDEDVYEVHRAFHISLENIEKKYFGYRIEFSVGLLSLDLRYGAIEFYSPLEAKTWVSIQNNHLKAHQLEQPETFLNEKSENEFTQYVVCFGSRPAVFTAEIVDPWNDKDQGDFTREEYKNINDQDHPRKLRGINFAGNINFQNIEDAKKRAENEISLFCHFPN